jgi:hypothetical protein
LRGRATLPVNGTGNCVRRWSRARPVLGAEVLGVIRLGMESVALTAAAPDIAWSNEMPPRSSPRNSKFLRFLT